MSLSAIIIIIIVMFCYPAVTVPRNILLLAVGSIGKR